MQDARKLIRDTYDEYRQIDQDTQERAGVREYCFVNIEHGVGAGI
jgi:hypothetical protein